MLLHEHMDKQKSSLNGGALAQHAAQAAAASTKTKMKKTPPPSDANAESDEPEEEDEKEDEEESSPFTFLQTSPLAAPGNGLGPLVPLNNLLVAPCSSSLPVPPAKEKNPATFLPNVTNPLAPGYVGFPPCTSTTTTSRSHDRPLSSSFTFGNCAPTQAPTNNNQPPPSAATAMRAAEILTAQVKATAHAAAAAVAAAKTARTPTPTQPHTLLPTTAPPPPPPSITNTTTTPHNTSNTPDWQFNHINYENYHRPPLHSYSQLPLFPSPPTHNPLNLPPPTHHPHYYGPSFYQHPQHPLPTAASYAPLQVQGKQLRTQDKRRKMANASILHANPETAAAKGVSFQFFSPSSGSESEGAADTGAG